MEHLWWGYRHVNGNFQVKRYFSREDIKEALSSPFASEVSGPWPAENREDALKKIKEKLGGD